MKPTFRLKRKVKCNIQRELYKPINFIFLVTYSTAQYYELGVYALYTRLIYIDCKEQFKLSDCCGFLTAREF